jgi:hypothetical protein
MHLLLGFGCILIHINEFLNWFFVGVVESCLVGLRNKKACVLSAGFFDQLQVN